MKNTKLYNELVQKLRTYFLNKGYVEVPTQSRLSILAACENPHSIATFNYHGEVWPLPQTGQMWLEYELLKNPHWNGCFCVSTSYRQEKNPIPGRHETIFPMFEFESKGGIEELMALEVDLLDQLGFESPEISYYESACEFYGTDIIEPEHEEDMCNNISTSIILRDFPQRSNPFWNMKMSDTTPGLYNKIDILLFGQETIGSAERSCDIETMRKNFYTIEDGNYCKKLFELFGRERVERELEEFFTHEFFPRFGGGIGMTRLARAYELNTQNLLTSNFL